MFPTAIKWYPWKCISGMEARALGLYGQLRSERSAGSKEHKLGGAVITSFPTPGAVCPFLRYLLGYQQHT